MFVYWYLWFVYFGWLLILTLYKEGYVPSFYCLFLDNTAFADGGKVWDNVNRFNHTIWIALANRPKSVRNRSLCNWTFWWRLCGVERKRKRSDLVIWQKPIHQQKCQKGKVTDAFLIIVGVGDFAICLS